MKVLVFTLTGLTCVILGLYALVSMIASHQQSLFH